MKTAIVLILFLVQAATGQMYYGESIWKDKPWGSVRVYVDTTGNVPVLSGKFISVPDTSSAPEYFDVIFIDRWDSYAKECYDDSTLTAYEWLGPDTTDSSGLRQRMRPLYAHWHEPTLNGFIEYLRKKVKK